jgi:hypothetical protein
MPHRKPWKPLKRLLTKHLKAAKEKARGIEDAVNR